MSEWLDKYNPFNSWKVLTHSKNFEAILKNKPIPPIVVNFDLTNKCNYNCNFCMFANRKRTDQTGQWFREGNQDLPKGYALKLPKIWKEWGVKSVCLAGGGEPSIHPDCKEFIKECNKQGLELGFVTNGYLVNDEDWWKVVAKNCKFIGFSVDAGNEDDYSKSKGVPKGYFEKVLNNIVGVANAKRKFKTKVQIGFKYLLDEFNYNSIYKAAEIASQIGVNHFQFRPAIDPNYKFFQGKIDMIWGQIEAAQKDFENKNFKVFGVKHKFNKDLSKKHCFNKCRANMLTTTWCANGKVYMCTDTRGNPWSYLVDHYPDPMKVIEYWGSKDHLEKVSRIDHKNCDRCTLTAYNEMFENVFIEDKMDRNLI